MLRLLQMLFFGHVHKWEELSRHQLSDNFGSRGMRVICFCKHCGKPKKFDLI